MLSSAGFDVLVQRTTLIPGYLYARQGDIYLGYEITSLTNVLMQVVSQDPKLSMTKLGTFVITETMTGPDGDILITVSLCRTTSIIQTSIGAKDA
jgi:hypothetical protein